MARSRTTDIPPAGRPEPPADVPAPAARLSLDPTLARGSRLDGAWWPRSHDPAAELPALVTALRERLGAVPWLDLDVNAWHDIPRRIRVAGRLVHVGWFADMDDQLIATRGAGDHFFLLVVPPEASAGQARAAMAAAASGTGSISAAQLLSDTAVGSAPENTALERWRDDGGAAQPVRGAAVAAR